MKVTASCEVRYHGSTNVVGNSAEDVALANVKLSERAARI